jgi:hypothetical protein
MGGSVRKGAKEAHPGRGFSKKLIVPDCGASFVGGAGGWVPPDDAGELFRRRLRDEWGAEHPGFLALR